MTSISKEYVSINKIDDILSEYIITYHSAIKIKYVDVVSSRYTDFEFRIEKVTNRKGGKIYVLLKGYDNSFNCWINKKDIAV